MLLLGTTYVLHAGKAAGQKYGFVNLYNKEHPSLLYQTYYNAIFFNDSLSPENLTFKANNIDVKKSTYFKIVYLRVLDGKADSVIVYNKSKKIGAFYFAIDRKTPLPYLKSCRGGRESGAPTSWSRVDTVYCEARNPLRDVWNTSIPFSVLSFVFNIERNGKVIFSEKSSGCTFPSSMKAEIMKSTIESKFVITEAVVRDDLNNIISIPRQELPTE